MIAISIKEAAALCGCTEQHLRKQALTGQIKTLTETTKNGRKKYMVPLSELSEAEQIRYYQQHDIDMPKKLQRQKASKQSERSTDIESYSANQREEIVLWSDILREWDAFCVDKPSKTQATKAYVCIAAEKYADLSISPDVLYRKKRALKKYGPCGLIDLRGGHNKGASIIPELVWQVFLYYYLDERKMPVTKCLEQTQWWLQDTHPECLPLPSDRTFYRHIESDITEALKTLGRDGQKAFDDRCGPYIRRVYNSIESNEWWVGDTHTLDIISCSGEVMHRLYIVAFMDVRSGIFVGWHVTLQPSSQATLIALRRGIIKHGIPKNVYVDNGREFLTKDVGGLGHRQKKSTKNEFTPPPVFERLGIKMTNALVKNAKAKIIERRFLDIKNGLSRLFDTFTGGTVVEKPEQLKAVLKGSRGEIPTDSDLISTIDEMIEYYFNYEEYNGAVVSDRGKLKIEVYNEHLKTKRVADENDLNLMLMRSSRKYKVGRRGVHNTIAGEQIDYWNDEFVDMYRGRDVYFRWDPDDLSYIRVYDLDDRYLMTVPVDNEAVLEYGSSQQDIKAAMGKTKSLGKKVREQLKEIKNIHGRKTALEIALRKAHANENIIIVEEKPVIQLYRADEQPVRLAVGAATEQLVSTERMIKNLEKNREN